MKKSNNKENKLDIKNQDLSERFNKSINEINIEDEKIYKALFNITNDCIAIYKAVDNGNDFVFVDFNPAAEKAEQLEKNKILGRLVTEVFPGVTEFGLHKVFQDVYKTGIPQAHPITFYSDMRITGWRDNYVYKLDENHIVAVYTDRTKEKQYEEELYISSIVFESTQEGILITDKSNRVIKSNMAFQKLTGFSNSEIIGKEANFLKSYLHTEEFYNDFWKSLKEKGHWKGEIWDKKKNGELTEYYLLLSAIKNDEGELTNYIGIYLDLTEQKRTEDYIHQLAYYDVLTNQGNRVLLDNELVKRVSKAKKYNYSMAVLFVDLDNFKYINDHYGHNIGDRILIETAKRLNSIIAKKDFLARHGGDEFVIVADELKNTDDVIELCSDITRVISEHYYPGRHKLYITLSIGISLYPQDGNDPQTLMRYADMAMYHSKNAGKNRFSFYNKEMNVLVSQRIEIENDLNNAVKKDEFYLEYQPKHCIQTGIITGLEALIRWKHPEKGIIPPSEFISIAETTGHIVDIGEQIICKVCNQIDKWKQLGIQVKVAVNVSNVQLKEADFLKRITRASNGCNCVAQDIEFEITESSIMENIDFCIDKLLTLKYRGYSLSIDDFGTGYSSMSYLQKLPVDVLKIDRSFIIELEKSNDGKEIVKAIIALAKSLSLKTVAEGVETKYQEECLKELGCNLVQGYLYNKPMSPEAITKLLK